MMNNVEVADFLAQRRARVLAESAVPRQEEAVDMAQVLLIERRDELPEPGRAAFSALWDPRGSAPVPLGPTDEPSGPPLTTIEEVFAWWAAHPRDGVGHLTGPSPLGATLALAFASWASWTTWRDVSCVEVRRIARAYGGMTEHIEARYIGTPSIVRWVNRRGRGLRVRPLDGPATELMDGVTTRDLATRLEDQRDLGGWLVWHTAGALRWQRRKLAPGLEVLEPGAVVPGCVAEKAGGWHLVNQGGPPDLGPLPDWLAALFGVRP